MPCVMLEQPFDLDLSLSMGQVFRWRCWKPINAGTREDDSSSGCWWSGVIGPYLVHLRSTDEGVEYRAGGPRGDRSGLDMASRLSRYFRDDDPVQDAYDSLKGDATVNKLLLKYPGMRVIRQDPWECLVTYVLTKGTPIERTKAIVEAMAERWGAAIGVRRRRAIYLSECENVAASGTHWPEQLDPKVSVSQEAIRNHH